MRIATSYTIGLTVAAVLLMCGRSHAQNAGTHFGQGRTRFSLTAGYGSFNDRGYAVVGAGAGYYLMDGFEAGVDGDAWLGNKPHIYSVSPSLRYVVTSLESFKPYLGGFYKRTFYDTLPSIDSAGGRAGVITSLGPHTYVSAGLVFERLFNCDKTLYDSCSLVYPEIALSVSY